ncbi:MAG: MFS transporter [Arthrobacter sp.]|nr:MFS transporter [Arthrobacter sp.]
MSELPLPQPSSAAPAHRPAGPGAPADPLSAAAAGSGTAASATASATPTAPTSTSRVLAATVVGTTLEFYDFYLYATAAVAVFPALFFGGADQQGALFASLATFAAAFVARPIGAVLFGHLGDRLGRTTSLLLSLGLMGGATVLIGLLPTATQIGVWAPALLAVLRFCQGLGLSGEWTGATLLATEHARTGRKGLAAAWPQLGAPFGFALANGAYLLLLAALGDEPGGEFMTWGWRVPFIAAVLMALVGWWIRRGVQEAPDFADVLEAGARSRRPVLEVVRQRPGSVLLGAAAMLSMYVIFYLMIAWSLSHALRPAQTGGAGASYGDVVLAQLAGVPGFALAVLAAGLLADRWGPRRAAAAVAVLVLCFGASFPWWFASMASGADAGGMPARFRLFILVGMVLMGLSSGTASALLPWLFPARLRFSGTGLSSNLAALLGAAATPYVAVWLDASSGVAAVGIYLSAAAAITLACAVLSGSRANERAAASEA